MKTIESKIFKEIQFNNEVDEISISNYLKNKQITFEQSKLHELFMEADTSQDGKLSFEEFDAFFIKKEKIINKIFYELDINHDNSITPQELLSAFQSQHYSFNQKQINQLVNLIDGNHTGNIEYLEFLEFAILIPGQNIQQIFQHITKPCMIDLGESLSTPHDDPITKTNQIKLLAGAIAGAGSRSITAPLDRIKTVMQGSSQNDGAFQTAKSLFKEDGIKSFFRGNGSNILKIAPETGIKFILYDLIKEKFCSDKHKPTMLQKFFSGGSAGLLTTMFVYPLDNIKTRMGLTQANIYSGFFDCVKKTFKNDGISGFYQGLRPSLLSVAPFAGIDLSINSTLKEMYSKIFNHPPGTFPLLAIGASSSLIAMLATYPFITIKVKMLKQSLPGQSIKYTGIWNCSQTLYNQNGIRVFYKGIIPQLAKTLPALSLNCVFYNKAYEFLQSYSH